MTEQYSYRSLTRLNIIPRYKGRERFPQRNTFPVAEKNQRDAAHCWDSAAEHTAICPNERTPGGFEHSMTTVKLFSREESLQIVAESH